MRARAVCAMTGAAIGWFAALPVQAQDVQITAPAPTADESELTPLRPDESDVLGRALVFDPGTLASDKPARPLKQRSWSKPADLDMKGTDKPDGSRSVAVKQPIPNSSGIDGSVGADLNLAANASNVPEPGKPLPGMTPSDTGGAAWASIGLPNFVSVDARVDPAADQGKIGGKLTHSVPVGRDVSVTLEDSYAVTERFGAVAPASPAAASLLAPSPVTAPAPAAGQVFDTSKSVKFVVIPTGTTFGAGWTTASNDPVTHNTLSADQKLLGPLHVTTAVTDVGQPTANKSITAGLKLNW